MLIYIKVFLGELYSKSLRHVRHTALYNYMVDIWAEVYPTEVY